MDRNGPAMRTATGKRCNAPSAGLRPTFWPNAFQLPKTARAETLKFYSGDVRGEWGGCTPEGVLAEVGDPMACSVFTALNSKSEK